MISQKEKYGRNNLIDLKKKVIQWKSHRWKNNDGGKMTLEAERKKITMMKLALNKSAK